MVRRAKKTVKKHLRLAGYGRWSRALVALVLVVSLCVPAFSWMNDLRAYAISPEAERVLGSVNKNLSAKFSFDEATNKWQFNKNGAAALAANIAEQQGTSDVEGVAGALGQLAAKQVGGSGEKDTTLYSVDLPARAKEGITYYDNVTKLSFKMVPSFPARDGKLVQDRIVYPFMDGGQIVYTAKTNGLKEDIVLSKFVGETVRYSYNLELPETLEARLLEDGSIGIYSANPALFGNISFSDDSDKARVMDARKNGSKDNLVFGIPAPFIKDQTGRVGHTKYHLNGNRLTVVASGLEELKYPLAVDPSVTITSSSDFQAGNDEGMIGFDTANQISRGGVTGGTTGTWDAAGGTAFTTKRSSHGTVAYNGYIYILGGQTAASTLSDVQYAALDSNGNVGTWQSTNGFTNGRGNLRAVAYNGYMYVLGGNSAGTSVLYNDIQYAPICDGVLNSGGCSAGGGNNGKLGTWQYTYNSASSGSFVNGFTNARYGHAVQVYSGYLYVMGGCTDTNNGLKVCQTIASDVQYAPLNANGTVGTWASANTGAAFTTRYNHASVVYNDYMYVLGGCISLDGLGNCNGLTNATQYAKINTNGTLGAWTTSSSNFTTARNQFTATVYNGYLYIAGGNATYNDVQYAQINANGTLGTWTTTTTFDTGGRYDHAMTQYKGYLYIVGGCNNNAGGCNGGNGYLTDTRKALIDPAGAINPYVTETDTIETDGLMHSATVAYNGFLYMLGGATGPSLSTTVTTVYYTALNSDGSTGAWSTTSAFNAQRAGAAAVAYNGYMYLLGGHHTTADTSCSPAAGQYCSDVQKAVINSDGTLGAWSSAGADYSTTGRGYLGAAAYNGYLYAFGGTYNNNTNVSAETSVGQIQANGNVTGWTTTGNLATAISNFSTVQHGPYVFTLGGRPSNAYTNGVQYAVLNDTGTMTWASTTAFTNARYTPSAGVYNGYVYLAGGEFGAGASNYSDTQYARICQTTATTDGCNGTIGTLGTWRSTKSFTTARGGSMGAIYNGYIYVMGGCSNWGLFGACGGSPALLNDLQYAKINNGGTGQTGSWTASSNGGGAALGGYTAYNGYVYSIKGCAGGIGTGDLACDNGAIGLQGMAYMKVNSDGSFGSWTNLSTTGTPPSSRYGTSAVAYNGYLYVAGGCTAYASSACSTYSKQVFYAQINSNGNVGTWATTTDFHASTGRYGLSTVAYNGYLYVVGGCTANSSTACTTYENTVRYAQINSNGTVGAWNSAGNNFSTPRFYHSAVAYSGNLYVIGGCSAMVTDACTGLMNDVQSISFNSNGTLNGNWRQATPFITPRAASGAVAYNGYLYVVGGCAQFNVTGGNCADYKNDIQYAPVSAGGNVGNWNKSVTNLTNGVMSHGLVVSDGYLVVVNGIIATHSFEGVARSSPLNVQSRLGRYSKLITVNPTTDIAGVYFNGSLDGGSSVTYRVAPSTGVFGAATPATQGTGSEPTPLCGQGTIYYVQVNITMGDNSAATFPESNISNVTDVTVYYRLNATPPPNLRLTGGKWFYSEIQQPLDICKQ